MIMNEISVRRALEVIRATRIRLISNGLNNDDLERRYEEIVELLTNQLTLLEFKSNRSKIN